MSYESEPESALASPALRKREALCQRAFGALRGSDIRALVNLASRGWLLTIEAAGALYGGTLRTVLSAAALRAIPRA